MDRQSAARFRAGTHGRVLPVIRLNGDGASLSAMDPYDGRQWLHLRLISGAAECMVRATAVRKIEDLYSGPTSHHSLAGVRCFSERLPECIILNVEKKNSDAKTDIFDEIRDWAEASSVSQEELRAWFDMLRRQTTPGSVFDAVFHTEVRRLSRLIILLINHLFGTHYTGDEKVLYGATEQPVRFPGGFYRMRRADSHFSIITGDSCQHVYHVECQTADDGSILLRVAEYDFMLALDHASDGDAFIEIPLPESAVVYLRSPAQKRRKLRYRITDSADRFVEQTIRTIAV